MAYFRIGTGFISHHERKGDGIGDGHGEVFRSFMRLILGEDVEEHFKFLVYMFGFSVHLQVIGRGEGYVIF